MTKTIFRFLGMLGTALAFGLLIAGCASTPRDPGSAAVKLAAEINAIKAGSARANGDTVTLTRGSVEVKKKLTVPEGVTLDLMVKGAALELRDGAVLTVNGVVNAAGHDDHGKGWGSLRIDDGTAVIAGTGTIKLKSKGRLLDIGGGKGRRQLTLDGVTLVGLPDNDSPLIGIYENSKFILKSGVITGNTYNHNDGAGGGGVYVWRGTFTMEGGTIYGNVDNLPAGMDASLANSARQGVSLHVEDGTAKWGTGGTYTKGGASQPDGSDIGTTDDTLIAIPAP
jgi:hypothetical protein